MNSSDYERLRDEFLKRDWSKSQWLPNKSGVMLIDVKKYEELVNEIRVLNCTLEITQLRITELEKMYKQKAKHVDKLLKEKKKLTKTIYNRQEY